MNQSREPYKSVVSRVVDPFGAGAIDSLGAGHSTHVLPLCGPPSSAASNTGARPYPVDWLCIPLQWQSVRSYPGGMAITRLLQALTIHKGD